MLEQARRSIALIGGAIGLTLIVGVAAAAGVVPHTGTANDGDVAAPAEPATGTETAAAVAAEGSPAPTTVTTAPAAAAAPTTSRSRSASAPAPSTKTAAASAAAATAPPSTLPARRNPSSAEVLAAMQTLKQRIPVLPLSESYGRDFGNQVCSAFDQGNGYAQVLAGVMAQASKIPLVTISPADAAYAISTAVQLFCPGHQARLG